MSDNCPNCGAQTPSLIASARVQACAYCGTTLVKEDAVLRAAGSAGEMFEAPSLFAIGDRAQIGSQFFTPMGHVRYDYGRGTWDEFWGQDQTGADVWVSVDEGDVAWQRPLTPDQFPDQQAFRLGAKISFEHVLYTTTEVENATCLAFRGQLPEAPELGETHMFANLTGRDGEIMSAERWDGGAAWFVGRWIDPFAVRTP